MEERAKIQSDPDRAAFERWARQSAQRRLAWGVAYHVAWATFATWVAVRWLEPGLHWGITWAAIFSGGLTWHLVDERLGRTASATGLLAGLAATALGAAVAATIVSVLP
jgi:hypothetical protein